MQIALAVAIGILFAAGIYMMLRRNLLKILIGLALLSHAVNLLIFTAAKLTRFGPPVIAGNEPKSAYADPIPQALILTAIVISFGVIAFAVGLAYRTHRLFGATDLEDISEMEDQ